MNLQQSGICVAVALAVVLLGGQQVQSAGPGQTNRLICLYNSSSFTREGKLYSFLCLNFINNFGGTNRRFIGEI